jgi:serine/threonine protein phosphatase PrpC
LVTDNRLLRLNCGFCTRTGRRGENQDFVGLCFGSTLERSPQGQVVAIADGVSHGSGGRIAAEITVRSFLDGHFSASPTAGVPRNAARIIAAINGWLHGTARTDPALAAAATTFTALVLLGRNAHVLHVGDTRAYLLHDEHLLRLTDDHTLSQSDLRHVLSRAVGMEPEVRLDHRLQSLRAHDRLLLCTDGVHGALQDRELRALLLRRRSPTEDAQHIVDAALAAGSQDNASCIIVDVLEVPGTAAPELQNHFASLPIRALPATGDCVDGFRITSLLSDGRYSRLVRAVDTTTGAQVVLKFPQPSASASIHHLAFVREAWVAARLHSPHIGEVLEIPAERQTRLYSAMPYYAGETLEQRLLRRPRLNLAEGIGIALKLAKAVAALHRAGIIHRDIKPDNVMLETGGGLRLIDLGVVRLPRMEDFPATDIPGTPSYMAPELFAGEAGSEASDQYAFGVTLYRAFTVKYPHGEIEPFTHPRFSRAVPLLKYRPDLPAWLEHCLSRALETDPAKRYGDVLELALALEDSMAQGEPMHLRRLSLLERNPLRFWQCVSLLLFIALLASLIWHWLGQAAMR